MILLDWTRLGKSYCLAGVIMQNGQPRVIRPLWSRHRATPVRNVGWSAYQMDGHTRWEVFELVRPEPAAPQPPHLEDVWVQGLRPRNVLAGAAQRRALLQTTLTLPEQPLFGLDLTRTRTAVYLTPGTGTRSLATVRVPSSRIRFSAAWRAGTPEPDWRVTLDLPDFAEYTLPVKDHFLLQRAEQAADHLEGHLEALALAVRQMGDLVAVRLGLSRAFPATPHRGEGICWLMADGFFSFTDPQC